MDLELYPGEVLAIIGDNGAGKSTLIKCLTGAHVPDAGEILVDGEPVEFESPQDARRAGIETVYQNLAVSPALDIASNLFLGRELRRPGFLGSVLRMLDKQGMRRQSRSGPGARHQDHPDDDAGGRNPVRRSAPGHRCCPVPPRSAPSWWFSTSRRPPSASASPAWCCAWCGLADAERCGRLVEDHDLRAERGRPGDGHGLALAAGQGLDGLGHGLQRRDAERLDLFLGPPRMPFLSSMRNTEPRKPGQPLLAAEVEVARDVERGGDGEVLVDRLDAGLAGVLRVLELDRLAVDEDLAGIGHVRPREALDERRLAGAVVADDGEHLAGVQLEVDAGEADDVPERLTRPLACEDGVRSFAWGCVMRVPS